MITAHYIKKITISKLGKVTGSPYRKLTIDHKDGILEIELLSSSAENLKIIEE